MEQQRGMCSTLQNCLHPKNLTKIKGKIIVQQSQGESAPGWAVSVCLQSSSIIDPATSKGKLSGSSRLRWWKTVKNHDGVKIIRYKVEFDVESDFGIPGAFRIKNTHKRRFFLQSAEFHDASKADSGNTRFYCHSWVYPYQQTNTDRLFFSNTSYLPSHTPEGLVELRKEELASLRGDGIEAPGTKEWVRIYDYDHSNDVGDPNMPYPRRGRTHEGSDSDPEGFKFDVYVPPDEQLSPKKMSELISNSIRAFVHFLLPELDVQVPSDKKTPEHISNSNQATDKAKSSSSPTDKKTSELKSNSNQATDNNFEYFDDILEMFKKSNRNPVEGWVAKKIKSKVRDDIFKKIVAASKEKEPKECPKPQIVAESEMAFNDDEEFVRQMLAGTNPAVIRRIDPQRPTDGESSMDESEIHKIAERLLSKQVWNILETYIHGEEFQKVIELIRGQTSTDEESSEDKGEIDKTVKRLISQEVWNIIETSINGEELQNVIDRLISQVRNIRETSIHGEELQEVIDRFIRQVWNIKETFTHSEELQKVIDRLKSQQATDAETFSKAIKNKKLFILDHLNYLLPVLKKMQKGQKDAAPTAYASQTLLLLNNNNTLTPLAILLVHFTDEGEEKQRAFCPSYEGIEGAMWQMAKTHVAVNDSCHHHLISHWLKTHAVVEPFIIATRRRLSAMHPIHRLLAPHFKGTMHVNALARSVLINPGGILEKLLATGKLSMELSSEVYKNDWKFDDQGLPNDLLKRGMAREDPDKPAGVRLLFEDYPYAADGLDIWVAIKNWVSGFCSHFYTDNESVKSDNELQEWWDEIRNVGHKDKQGKKSWNQMTTLDELTEALTTLIWIASALHAAMNFGQYAYAGYPPNRPTLCRKFIPDDKDDEDFRSNPSKYYLQMLPGKFEMRLSAALAEVLSQQSSEQVYLGQGLPNEWTEDETIQGLFTEFRKKLRDVEKNMRRKNRDPSLRNRWGPAKILYKSLFPNTSNNGHKAGLTGKGIPNSISI